MNDVEPQGALADLDGALGISRQTIIAIEKIKHPSRALLVAELFRQVFRGVQVFGDPRRVSEQKQHVSRFEMKIDLLRQLRWISGRCVDAINPLW